MAKTGIVHHVGTLLLLVSAILLLITTISAPVVNDISIFKVTLTNSSTQRNSSVTFGTFGWCIRDAAQGNEGDDYCSGKHIGYNPAKIISAIDQTRFNTASENTTKALTRVMVLHPICCGLAFIAFLLALGSGIVGSLLASIVSGLTFVLTLVVMATDFVLFGILKNHVNDKKDDQSGSKAEYYVGMWTVLAAMILLFFATFIVLFSCCSARRHKRNAVVTPKHHDAGYATGPTVTTHKRRFWQRRNRY
ncbi:SUR7/PalI family-domain-containing protein [Bisporella sp. PMI_857]|nr:SUR7/PalI family-domain-containing protein [Bisporella sp. PMI_857]